MSHLSTEKSQRWHLFIHPRANAGLTLLSQQYCHSQRLQLLLHAIGSGTMTLSPQPDLNLAKQVAQPAIEIQKELSAKALLGDRAALFAQSQIPPDLQSLRVTIVIEQTVRLLLADLASRLNTVPHVGSQTTSVSALLKAIGTGEVSVVNIVDPEIRLRYLRNTDLVREYLCLQKAKRDWEYHASRATGA